MDPAGLAGRLFRPHGPLVVQALRAGKHVYSAVLMAISHEEIAAIIGAVRETG